MNRTIKNMLKGRKKVYDESVEYAAAWKVFNPIIHCLSTLDEKVRVTIRDSHTWEHKRRFNYETHDGSSEDIKKYLEDRYFTDDPYYYYSSKWQIFYGGSTKHTYIDIQVNSKTHDNLAELFEAGVGPIVRKMRIEYIVQNTEKE